MTGSAPTLVQGRTIYVTRCAKCHAVEPVKKYSREQWKTIIPDMAEETKLSPSETAAVAAYIHSILDG